MAAIYLKYKRKSDEFFTNGKIYAGEDSKEGSHVLLITNKGNRTSLCKKSLSNYFQVMTSPVEINKDNSILKVNDAVIFGNLKYIVRSSCECYFLSLFSSNHNDAIFNLLEIEDKYGYVTKVIGTIPRPGNFPEVSSLEDLTKIVHALQNDYKSKFGKTENKEVEKTPLEKVEEVNFSPGDWVVFDVEKAKETRFYTSVWNKPYVLQISEMLSGHPQFSKERMIAAGCDTSILSSTCGNSVTLFRHATPEEIEKATKPKVEESKKESIPIGSYVVITEASGILESQDEIGQVLKLIAINPLSKAKYICEDVFGRYSWAKGDFLSDYGATTSAKSCCKEVRLATEDDIAFVKRDLKTQERIEDQSIFLQEEIKSDVPKKVSFRDFLKSL